MTDTRIEDFFVTSTSSKFAQWCHSEKIEPTTENMLRFLMSHTYIERKNVERSFVLDYVNQDVITTKTSRVWEIESEFGISETKVWTILKHYAKRFIRRKTIPPEPS